MSSTEQAHIEQAQIDWSAAEIKDSNLTVALSGDLAKGWARRFQEVLALLEQGHNDRWGPITATRKAIKVADVQEGAEEDLRHFLQSIILQVNRDLEPEEENEDSATDPLRAADERMAARFREFSHP